MGDFRSPQTPGIGGLEEITSAEELWLQSANAGVLRLSHITAPTGPLPGIGRIYVKSIDSALYFLNASGVEFNLTAAGGAPHNVLSATHPDTLVAGVVLGDLIIGNATPLWARLPGNTTTTKRFLTQTGTGTVSAIPAWGAIASGDLPPLGVLTGHLADLNVTYAKIQNISATDRLLGRATAGAGIIEEIVLTAAGRALIDDLDATAQRATLGAAATVHTHSAADTTSGRFPMARMLDGAVGQYIRGAGVGIDPAYSVIPAGDIPSLPASRITSERFGMPRMPDGISGQVLTAQGAGLNPIYAPAAGGGATNSDRVWIAHGDNVITFPTAHSNANYRWVATLSQAPMGEITPRNVSHTRPLSVFVSNESTTRGKVRIEGGFGFTSCGIGPVGTTERFDDVANTHTTRALAIAREWTTGYSLNGFGFTSCGQTAMDVGTTERFDDVANTHTARASATARSALTGYSLNGFGFTSCGWAVGTTERFDDVSNTHTARTAATARATLTGYSLNGFGFTSVGTTNAHERFDDVANTHTARALATAREAPAGYSLNGFGFISCGGGPTGLTERFDDVANTHTARASATARGNLPGYSLNGFGFTSCGFISPNNVGTVERFDDVANTHTARTATTIRRNLAGYSLNEYFINYISFNQT